MTTIQDNNNLNFTDGTKENSNLFKYGILLALSIGIPIAAYLTYQHLDVTFGTKASESVCNISETFNCDKVNTSDASELFGISIALYAIPTYLLLAFLTIKSILNKKAEQDTMPWVFGISLLTVVSSVGLGLYSSFVIEAYCLFCISLYVVNILTFVFSLVASKKSFSENISAIFSSFTTNSAGLFQSIAVFLVAMSTSLLAHSQIKSTLLEENKAHIAQDQKDSPQQNKKVSTELFDADDASYGPSDAKVTLVEFADFECGYCKRMSYTIKSLKDQYGDRVRFVFKHFPMSPKCNDKVQNDKHKFACNAAFAGLCANKMGKFWEFHDLTFKNQRNLRPENLLDYAQSVGLDPSQVRQCMDSPEIKSSLHDDTEVAAQNQITGTPRIFVNGVMFKGIVPKEILEEAILKALGETTAPPTTPSKETTVAVKDPSKSPEMVEISIGEKHFFIDAFESSAGKKGEALSQYDKAPFSNVSWYTANSACTSVGKRLCTQDEWVTACQNASAIDDNNNNRLGDDKIEGTEFSYGDFYLENNCNDKQEPQSEKIAFTGNFPRCVTPSGVFDMNGNIQEWVGASEERALLMGGNYYGEEKASCFQVQDTFGPGYANTGTGFRCCKNAP